MSESSIPPVPNSWKSALWGLIVIVFAALARWWPVRVEKRKKDNAEIAKVESDERMKILEMYKSAVEPLEASLREELKGQVLAMATRHERERREQEVRISEQSERILEQADRIAEQEDRLAAQSKRIAVLEGRVAELESENKLLRDREKAC